MTIETLDKANKLQFKINLFEGMLIMLNRDNPDPVGAIKLLSEIRSGGGMTIVDINDDDVKEFINQLKANIDARIGKAKSELEKL